MTNQTLIRKWALQNAVKYGGKANPGAIIGKLLAEHPELKNEMKTLSQDIQKIVKEVNSLAPEKQRHELEQEAPELLVEKKKEETHELPELKNAVPGKVITAFPPEPSGVAHIGHVSGALFNMLYAQRYNGKFYLRFEDTNPELGREEFQESITKELQLMGLKWDKVINISDTMPEMYVAAEKLLKKGLLYACSCQVDDMRANRASGTECEHRNQTPEQNMRVWNELLDRKHAKGTYVVRYKGNMTDSNSVMRDPTMFRIIDAEHYRQGKNYLLWPSYDFAAAFSDGNEGITHRVRSKEFELRAELQRELQQHMGFTQTIIVEQARINLEGVEASKRKIRDRITAGELTGWEDIRLTTLPALRRRGFTPQGIKQFLLNVGITKNERTLGWASLEAENRKILDPVVNRYFFIQEPVKITIAKAPEQTADVAFHPEHPEQGRASFKTHTEFYLAKKDVEELKQRSLYRLMDCLNFTKTTKGYAFNTLDHEAYKEKGKKIMHWLPYDPAQTTAVEVLMPDATQVTGLGDARLQKLKVGDIVQFTRFGFVRLDEKRADKLVFWYGHK